VAENPSTILKLGPANYFSIWVKYCIRIIETTE
jgi:hypothetical protein